MHQERKDIHYQTLKTTLILNNLTTLILSHRRNEKLKGSEFDMDFAERIKDLRRTGAVETEHTRKLIESLDTIDDIELTALRIPKRILSAKGTYGLYPPPPPSTSDGTEAPIASPTPSPVPSPTPVPSAPIAVTVKLTFQADYNTIASQLASFKADVQSSIAALLGLKPSQINVTSVTPGSVIVTVNILADATTLSAVQSSAATLSSKAQSLATAFAKYGVTGVSVTLSGSPVPAVGTLSPPVKAPAPQPQAASTASAALITMAMSCVGAFFIAALALM